VVIGARDLLDHELLADAWLYPHADRLEAQLARLRQQAGVDERGLAAA
jgi:hypothetical protein